MLFLAGTNEAAITEVLAHRTIAQRQRIKEAYKQAVGKVRGFDWAVLKGSKRSVFVNEKAFLHHKSTLTKQRHEHQRDLKCTLDGDCWQQQWMCHLLASYSIMYSLIILSLKVGFCCAIIVLIMCKLTINCKAEMIPPVNKEQDKEGLVMCRKGGMFPPIKQSTLNPQMYASHWLSLCFMIMWINILTKRGTVRC